MTIVLTGGGSGGHITPILAVADELKKIDPSLKLVYIGQRGDKFAEIAAASQLLEASYTVSAGKWRRYHGEGWRQLLDIPTLTKNIRDFFRMLAGTWQAYLLLGKLGADAMFTPGGFVGVPVGLAARLRGVPVITHDLDAHPGLANRINARWAAAHAVGQPADLYQYPKAATYYVGVPVAAEFKTVTPELQAKAKQSLGLKNDQPVLFVTGGGLGARRLNAAVTAIVKDLFASYPDLVIFHTAGQGNEEALQTAYNRELSPKDISRIQIMGFTSELYRYSAAADVVITRAGATTMAELAAQHKACIIIPNPVLTGGHQLKNVMHLEKDDAVKVLQEKDLAANKQVLLDTLRALLDDDKQRRALGERFGTYAMPDAARDLAELIIKVSKREAHEA